MTALPCRSAEVVGSNQKDDIWMPLCWTKRRERSRSIIADGEYVYPPSVYDPISACIAEDIGYEAGLFAGSVASTVVLRASDIVVLTLTELADQAHRISAEQGQPHPLGYQGGRYEQWTREYLGSA